MLLITGEKPDDVGLMDIVNPVDTNWFRLQEELRRANQNMMKEFRELEK
jgi:hypothetical protein